MAEITRSQQIGDAFAVGYDNGAVRLLRSYDGLSVQLEIRAADCAALAEFLAPTPVVADVTLPNLDGEAILAAAMSQTSAPTGAEV